MADTCLTDFTNALNGIRAKGDEYFEEAIESADKDLGEHGKAAIRKLHEELEQDFKGFLGKLRDEFDEGVPNEDRLNLLIEKSQKQIFQYLDRVRAVKNNTEILEMAMEKSDDIRAVKGIVGRLFQWFENASRREEDLFVAREVDLWKKIEEGGTKVNPDSATRAKEFMRDAQAGGTKLYDDLREKGHANPHRTMYEAVKKGSSSASEELNIIAKLLKQLKEYKEMTLKTKYPGYIQPLTDFSYRLDLAKVYDKEAFILDMARWLDPAKYLGMSQKEFDALGSDGLEKFIKTLIDQHRELVEPKVNAYKLGRRGPEKNPFLPNNWPFKENQFEFEFIAKYADTRGGILGSHRNFLKNQVANAGRESVMSKDPGATFSAMRATLYSKYKDQTKRGVEDIDQVIEPHVEEYRDRYEPKNVINEDLANIRTAATQLVSASLLGKSSIRNQANDNTVHASLVWHAHNDSGGITTYLQRAVALSRDIALGAAKGTVAVGKALGKIATEGRLGEIESAKLSPAQEELQKWFQDQGLVIDVQMNAAVAGVRKSKYDITPIAAEGDKNSKWSKFWAAAARWSREAFKSCICYVRC